MTDEPTGAVNPDAAQGGDTPQGEPGQPAKADNSPDGEALWKSIAPHFNRAFHSQAKGFEERIQSLLTKPTTPEPTEPKPQQQAKGPKQASEVEALQAQIDALKQARETEKQEARKQRNDLDLMAAVQATGTHRTEEMFRFLKLDSALREDAQTGGLFAVDEHGGHMSLKDWASSVYQASPTWRPPSGRGGVGGPGDPGGLGGGQGGGKTYTQAEWDAKIGGMLAEGKEAEASALMQQALDGHVEIK